MQLQSKNLNKVRALLYTILKYSFKQYFEFGSVSPFWIWCWNNICAWVNSIQLLINVQYIPTYFIHIYKLCEVHHMFYHTVVCFHIGYKHSPMHSYQINSKVLQGLPIPKKINPCQLSISWSPFWLGSRY